MSPTGKVTLAGTRLVAVRLKLPPNVCHSAAFALLGSTADSGWQPSSHQSVTFALKYLAM